VLKHPPAYSTEIPLQDKELHGSAGKSAELRPALIEAAQACRGAIAFLI